MIERKEVHAMRTISSIRFLFFALLLLCLSASSYAQVSIGISVGYPPPPLPVYEQPICPEEGYIWTPGYWAWDGNDYFWVPGTWVLAPEPGFFWTPAYWGWSGAVFVFHEGYWGPRVGFYGGINYGYGYFGRGYEGGRWDHDRFYYNRSVNNVNVTEIHNTYNTTIINNNTTINRVSYNGGNGGINERPTAEEEVAGRGRHIRPVGAQNQHFDEARSNRELRASVNHGKPPVAATPRPGAFHDRNAMAAREAGGRYEPPANRKANVDRPPNAGRPTHANELSPHERFAPPNTGNPSVWLNKMQMTPGDNKQSSATSNRRSTSSNATNNNDSRSSKNSNHRTSPSLGPTIPSFLGSRTLTDRRSRGFRCRLYLPDLTRKPEKLNRSKRTLPVRRLTGSCDLVVPISASRD